jgi:hypothetical protein
MSKRKTLITDSKNPDPERPEKQRVQTGNWTILPGASNKMKISVDFLEIASR